MMSQSLLDVLTTRMPAAVLAEDVTQRYVTQVY